MLLLPDIFLVRHLKFLWPQSDKEFHIPHSLNSYALLFIIYFSFNLCFIKILSEIIAIPVGIKFSFLFFLIIMFGVFSRMSPSLCTPSFDDTVTNFLRSCQLCSYSRISKPEGSLQRSQDPSTSPYAELDQSSPYHHILSLGDPF
jgi:hypothetical protein